MWWLQLVLCREYAMQLQHATYMSRILATTQMDKFLITWRHRHSRNYIHFELEVVELTRPTSTNLQNLASAEGPTRLAKCFWRVPRSFSRAFCASLISGRCHKCRNNLVSGEVVVIGSGAKLVHFNRNGNSSTLQKSLLFTFQHIRASMVGSPPTLLTIGSLVPQLVSLAFYLLI